MKRIVACGLALGLLAGCVNVPAAPVATSGSGGVTPATVCATIAGIQGNSAATAQLAAIPPSSALGVVWADLQSGCIAGAPAGGVDTSWTAMVLGMFKTLLPQVLPTVLPLLIGLL
jgi:hypothetical protein